MLQLRRVSDSLVETADAACREGVLDRSGEYKQPSASIERVAWRPLGRRAPREGNRASRDGSPPRAADLLKAERCLKSSGIRTCTPSGRTEAVSRFRS